MERSTIYLEGVPLGLPYSHAVQYNGLIFVTGQVGIDLETMRVVAGGVEAQTRRTLENVRAILGAAGTSLQQVLKVTIFVSDIDDLQAINAVYREYFPHDLPARSAFQVARLWNDCLIEIEVIAASTQ